MDRLENSVNIRGIVYLLDGCVLELNSGSLFDRLSEYAFYKESSTPQYFRDNLNQLTAFCRFAHANRVHTIPEVTEEQSRLIEILKVKYRGVEKILHDMKAKKQRSSSANGMSKFPSSKSEGLIHNCSSFLSDLDTYIKSKKKVLNILKDRALHSEELNEKQKEIYDIALYESGFYYKDGRGLKEDEKKLGDKLKTDQKLIASTLAFSLNAPVILISWDKQLLRTFSTITKLVLGEGDEITNNSVYYCSPPLDHPIIFDEKYTVQVKA